MMQHPRRGFVAVLILTCSVGCTEAPAPAPAESVPAASFPAGDWPQWRGPDRDGHSPSTGLLERWSPGEPRQLWRRELGEGFSGISIVGDRLFTLFAQGQEEYLVALNARSGEELWRLPMGQSLQDGNGNGPRSTPTVESGVVYALGSLGRLVAATADRGRVIWQLDKPVQPPTWGFSSSPLVEGGLLVVHGPAADAAVLAVDKATGERVWTAGEGNPGYASPVAVTLHGERQIVSFIASGLVGLAAASGEVRWRQGWTTSWEVNAADPIFLSPDRFFLSSGYDQGAMLIRVVRTDGGFDVEEIWRSRDMQNHFNSSLVVGDDLYGFHNATLRCLEVATGKVRWQKRGLGRGSLIHADGKLLVLGGKGVLALVEAAPEAYRELGRVQALQGRSWTPPALAGRWLYLRNHAEIVCLDLGGDRPHESAN